MSLRQLKQAEAALYDDDDNLSEDEIVISEKAEEQTTIDQSGTWTEVPAAKRPVSRQRSSDRLLSVSQTITSPKSSQIQLGSHSSSSPYLGTVEETGVSAISGIASNGDRVDLKENSVSIGEQALDTNQQKIEINASVIGGLMQGFAGTQSLLLRDAQYHRLKLIGLTEKRAKLLDGEMSAIDYQPRTKLRIIDARPLISAKGNVLMGKGHEVIDRLGGARCTSMEYAGIANIHGVKDSYTAMRKACAAASCTGRSAYDNWLPELHESRWLQHIGSIMFAATCTAVNLNNGDPGNLKFEY